LPAADPNPGAMLRSFRGFGRCSAMIRKLKSGEYRLYSRKKGSDGKRKNLGTFSSRAGAEKHEREVQGFKHR
jgi:hypothetical protein